MSFSALIKSKQCVNVFIAESISDFYFYIEAYF